MITFPMPRSLGEYLQDKCESYVQDGKGKCTHDGSKGGSRSYSMAYLLNIKRDNPFERNKAQVRFFYHTIQIADIDGKREVERCEVKASEECLKLIGDTIEIGGYLTKLGMHFIDAQGKIDTAQLKPILEMAVKLVDGTGNPEIKIILDK